MLKFDTDVNELVYLARCGSQTAYSHLYQGLRPVFIHQIRSGAGRLSDADYDEMLSVSMEMLHTALCAWRPQGGLTFCDYTSLIFSRRMHSIAKRRFAPKAKAMNYTLSLTEPYGHYSCLADQIESPDRMNDPCFALQLGRLRESLQKARDILPEDYLIAERYWENGCTYQESAEAMDVTFKAYDGKLRRAKQMMRSSLLEDDYSGKGLV